MIVSATIEKALSEQAFPIRDGVFVAVAGPSGAGKDTLMDFARRHFAERSDAIVFVRRIVTRPADTSNEDHDTISKEAFDKAHAEGRFSISWKANGLCYALPAEVDDILRKGGVVVANVSRAAIPEIEARYRNVAVIIVTAPAEVLAERLAGRGRESHDEILARLERNANYANGTPGATVIDNSGTLEEGGARFVTALSKALAWSAVCDSI
ncbi:ribose 1,5-bisphosphokinase [Mesorhizobium sp. J18]|uniref:phosphonate metabolism protein/1,5-bisphosphokinase (PRPP-forming) PhnN n=1 Tax=Mesorhizobium sp. J18 TaxID=935263 RepID=UPI00119B6BAF|nr:phosphonate metabolism protein/1,5-bisphosphokinase (PRPP-forming) PhnN [Mesorhizobium sp. J18]TWG91277.1 ribose 1,5-bisphosphokinase [Mesorhizobium sp. J18]